MRVRPILHESESGQEACVATSPEGKRVQVLSDPTGSIY